MLQLRSASQTDAAFFYLCNNERSTREVSRSTAPLAREEHQRWLYARLRDPGCQLYIIELDGLPLGNVRLQRAKHTHTAEISIALLPEARAKRLGAQAILLACQRQLTDVDTIEAWIWEQNVPSLRCFERCGFLRVRELLLDGKIFFIYQRRAAAQSSGLSAEL